MVNLVVSRPSLCLLHLYLHLMNIKINELDMVDLLVGNPSIPNHDPQLTSQYLVSHSLKYIKIPHTGGTASLKPCG